MKKINKLILNLITIFSISACAKVNVDDNNNEDAKPTYECTYLETQYQLNFAFRSSFYDGTVFVYKDNKSLTSTSNTATPYYWWNFYKSQGNDYGKYQDYDPFIKYDSTFFVNHILMVSVIDLNPDGEIYFINLDTELTKSSTNENTVYYNLNYYIVYPKKTDKVYSKIDKKCTYAFFEIETNDPKTTYSKYTVDPVYYYRWTIYKEDYPNYFNYNKNTED